MSLSSSLGSASSAPISFSGLATGLNTSSIIQKLLSLDQAPITAEQAQVTAAQNQQSVYTQLQSLLQTLQQASVGLNSPSAFQSVSGSSSNTAVASVSTTGSALAGTYNLTVNQLAQGQKISSSAQADTTSALNMSGTIVVNGKSMSIASTDSLTSIVQNINGLGAGVTASLLNGGTNNAYLTLTSNTTGAASKIEFADVSGTALESLGLTTGTTSVANPVTNGAQSYGLSSGTATLQGLMGTTTSGSITINGTAVAVDFSTDSLQTIANNINSNVSGVAATVQTVTNNGTTSYKLQITGTSGTPTFTDSGNVLQSIGVLQQGDASELVKAQDAQYSLDNVNLTSSTNTITTAIPGASLTLLQGTPTSPGTSTLNFSQNTAGITSNLQNFVSAYNAVNDFINQESQFNTSTYQSGPLFGDPVVAQVSNQLSAVLFNNVAGYTGKYPSLASLGFTLSQTGDLSLNQTTISNALQSDPTDVANLFEAAGTGSNSNLSYVSSNSATQASANGPYPVNITQLATEASYSAGTAQTQPASNAETLTFSGGLFNSVPQSIILNVGATLQQSVDQINNDSSLSTYIKASINSNGELQIDSRKYGAIGNFTVSSNLPAGASTSGVGTSGGTMTAGLDVQGTIDGEAATGVGQVLTGATGNANTSGLSLLYTGSTTGLVGTMGFSSGIANQISNLATNMSNPSNGLIATQNNALNSQITSYQADIASLQAQLTLEQQNLTQQFSAMESAIAQLQAQGSSLSSLSSLSSSSSSSGSSSSSNSSSSSA